MSHTGLRPSPGLHFESQFLESELIRWGRVLLEVNVAKTAGNRRYSGKEVHVLLSKDKEVHNFVRKGKAAI
jgi:hypothetical protein